eukprot:TRINITY_DN15238_c0_g1_i1.p2 TRINITY_DN15238_c0_g1~~TRINITY_DN15238_c0_g1_i1.p2  ORF type:complete len:112 (+),score=2.92 TRINITY_DN15238_c0_g1_i1:85-420(+)
MSAAARTTYVDLLYRVLQVLNMLNTKLVGSKDNSEFLALHHFLDHSFTVCTNRRHQRYILRWRFSDLFSGSTASQVSRLLVVGCMLNVEFIMCHGLVYVDRSAWIVEAFGS